MEARSKGEASMIFSDHLRAAADVPIDDARDVPLRTPPSKRVLDIVIASACLILVSPLLVLVAVLIKLTSPGPALFRQTRLGRGQRPFVLYKFRTMHAGSPDDVHRNYVTQLLTLDQPPTGGRQGLYKLENDTRITKVGRLLRRTSIDKLATTFIQTASASATRSPWMMAVIVGMPSPLPAHQPSKRSPPSQRNSLPSSDLGPLPSASPARWGVPRRYCCWRHEPRQRSASSIARLPCTDQRPRYVVQGICWAAHVMFSISSTILMHARTFQTLP